MLNKKKKKKPSSTLTCLCRGFFFKGKKCTSHNSLKLQIPTVIPEKINTNIRGKHSNKEEKNYEKYRVSTL